MASKINLIDCILCLFSFCLVGIKQIKTWNTDKLQKQVLKKIKYSTPYEIAE